VHSEALNWVRSVVGRLGGPQRILEFGSQDLNGSCRTLFPDVQLYDGVDQVDGPGVDWIADAAEFRHKLRGTFDVVVCTEVLEHTPRARDLLMNALVHVHVGGHLLMTCAAPNRGSHSARVVGALQEGEWYANIRVPDLVEWLQPWRVNELHYWYDRGDLYAWCEKPTHYTA